MIDHNAIKRTIQLEILYIKHQFGGLTASEAEKKYPGFIKYKDEKSGKRKMGTGWR